MKTITSIVAILLGVLFLQAANPPITKVHRGRIQIQGPDMKNFPNGELSLSWTRTEPPEKPPTKAEAIAELDKMWNQLSKTQQKVRKDAYAQAKKWIQGAPEAGVDDKVSKSFLDKGQTKNRIDIEVIKGKAFTEK